MKNLLNTSTRTHRLGAVAVIGALAFGAAACGSDEPAAEPAATDPATTDAMADPATTDAMADPATTDAAPAAGAGPAAVTVVDFNYDPNPVEVAAGTEITWTNEDGFAHTVTNDGGDLEFDSGNFGEGDTFVMTFDEPGTYAYICTIHNQMKAEIVVS